MTNDEIAIAILARRGFLVIASMSPREVGEILRPTVNKIFRWGIMQQPVTPLRVVAGATCAEYNAQADLVGEIRGEPTQRAPSEHPYFYRVEAAD